MNNVNDNNNIFFKGLLQEVESLVNSTSYPKEDKVSDVAEKSLKSDLEPSANKKRRLVKIQNATGSDINYSIGDNPHNMRKLPLLSNVAIDPVKRIFLHKIKVPLQVELKHGVTAYYLTEKDNLFINVRKGDVSNNSGKSHNIGGESADIIWENLPVFCPHDKVTHLTVISRKRLNSDRKRIHN